MQGFDPATRKTAQLTQKPLRFAPTPAEEAARCEELLALRVESMDSVMAAVTNRGAQSQLAESSI